MNGRFRRADWRAGALLLLLLLVAPSGCKRRRVRAQASEERGASGLASAIHMGDPRMAGQLAAGFHGVENNAWRWTERRFAVVLHPPSGSAGRGAFLSLKLTVPAVVIERESRITLSALIGGSGLAPETYTKPGEYTYRREVPAAALTGDGVRVDFELDKALPPGPMDLRELGVVVSAVSLEGK